MKGVSPIISAVLLIAFTLTVASISAPFFTQQVQKVQDSNSEQAQEIMTATDLGLDIRSATYNRTTTNLTVLIQNTGNKPVENISLTVFGDNIYHEQYSKKLAPQRVGRFEINAGDNWDLNSIEAALTDYPVSVERKLDGRPAEASMIGRYSFTEGFGVFANDSTTTEVNGKLRNGTETCTGNGCPTWTNGLFNGAIALDGNHDYVMIDTKLYDTQFTGPVTYMLIVKPVAEKGSVITDGNDGEGRITINPSTDQVTFNHVGNQNTGAQFGDLNKWHTFIMSSTGANGTLIGFNNGILKKDSGQCAVSWCGPDGYIRIGGGPNHGYTQIVVDEVRIWNTALTKQQIKDPVVVR